jgi:hypothetical protein
MLSNVTSTMFSILHKVLVSREQKKNVVLITVKLWTPKDDRLCNTVLVKGRVHFCLRMIFTMIVSCTVNLSIYNVLYMFQVNLITAGRVLQQIPSFTVLIFWLWLLSSTGWHCDWSQAKDNLDKREINGESEHLSAFVLFTLKCLYPEHEVGATKMLSDNDKLTDNML